MAVAEANGMARVVTSLIPGDTIKIARQDIDDLALALIAPLKAYDCCVVFHSAGFSMNVYPQGSSISRRSCDTSG
jgi:hypothetical protein